jgi:hypothetical protein
MLVGGLENREGPPATRTWQGQPRSLHRGEHGGTGPLPGGRGVRAPEAGWSGQARDGTAITRSGPGPPWGVRVCGVYPSAPCLPWHAEAPDLRELGEGPETTVPASGPGRMPRHLEGEGEITYGDTLRAWTP